MSACSGPVVRFVQRGLALLFKLLGFPDLEGGRGSRMCLCALEPCCWAGFGGCVR